MKFAYTYSEGMLVGVAVPLGIDPLLSLIWCTYNRYDSCNYLKRVLSLVWDHVVEFVNYYDNGMYVKIKLSTTADSYSENFNDLKERTSVINKRLKTENEEYKKLTQRIIVNTCNSGAESIQDLDTNFGRISEIIEDQNKVMVDTHELTKKVIDSLKSKEIYCLRDWIRKFFIQAASGKVNFRSQDEEYISQLKITLDEVQMSIYDFEKLYKMKNESNVEFQDQENTLGAI
ncbi:hypothetical protein RhiirA5_413033 [Rhizophagus irregularis]|uniref:Uncharacterized protein n=1 Tax=Rhizophagus irregularis TaxID=588596 RepID=A0A2I1EGX1_9GLOM|nr:hypothetical protein RhiirA5_413033 [Rhizophagus irregularis]PKC65579.1 hypothetical protein RhiirA1_460858 [Rhizophagus irregularis]PKY21367.1 hypothetical protein RhiirB3_524969 [Rhizophagus irregularis]